MSGPISPALREAGPGWDYRQITLMYPFLAIAQTLRLSYAALFNTHAHTHMIPRTFTRLEYEQRAIVDTATAAYHLNRKSQTLRLWAMRGDGPLKPIHVNGRLGWRVSDLRSVLGLNP